MVSSSLDMSLEELFEVLERLRVECADDEEYSALRAQLPANWPL